MCLGSQVMSPHRTREPAQAFERKGLQLPEQLRQRARLRLAAAPEDRDAVDVTGALLA